MKTKELQRVNFEQAKRLQNVGFDWIVPSFYYSNENSSQHGKLFVKELSDLKGFQNWKGWHCWTSTLDIRFSAPTVELALEWFREEKGIPCSVSLPVELSALNGYVYYIQYWNGKFIEKKFHVFGKYFKDYESAASALLDELLTLIEKQK